MSEAVATQQATTAAPAAAPTASTSVPSVQGAPVGQKASAAPQSAAEQFEEIQVDGKPVKMSRDEMKRWASLGKAGNSRFEEAAKIRKDSEAKLEKIKDPKSAMKFLTDPANGYNREDVRAAFEDWYKETYIDPEQMSPQEREAAQIKKENAELKAYREQKEKEAHEAKEKSLDAQTSEALQRELTTLLEESGLPKTKFTASRLAYWIRVNETKGLNAPKELILEQVRKETRDVVSALALNADGEKLVGLLGEDVVKKIRQYDLARIRAARGTKEPQTQNELQENKPQEKITPSEVRRRARGLYK